MTLEYLTLRLPLTGVPTPQWIESQLSKRGAPIRWAITSIEAQECIVEAVVDQAEALAWRDPSTDYARP